MIRAKISASQLFCVLLLTRLSSEIVYPRTTAATAADAVIALIIAELIRFALALPVILYSFSGADFYRAVLRKNKLLGWISACFAAVLLLGAALRTLFYSSQFAAKNLLVGGEMWIIFAITAVFAVYAAMMGTEALARSGAIFLIAAAVVSAAVMLADIPYMQPISDFTSNSGSLLGDIIERVMRGGDYVIFAALLPYVNRDGDKNSAGKAALFFALFSTLAALLVCVVNCLVLREMYGLCEYPFIAAASLSDITLFKRLDGIAAAVWTLCAAYRGGVLLLSAYRAVAEVYGAGQRSGKKENKEAQ